MLVLSLHWHLLPLKPASASLLGKIIALNKEHFLVTTVLEHADDDPSCRTTFNCQGAVSSKLVSGNLMYDLPLSSWLVSALSTLTSKVVSCLLTHTAADCEKFTAYICEFLYITSVVAMHVWFLEYHSSGCFLGSSSILVRGKRGIAEICTVSSYCYYKYVKLVHRGCLWAIALLSVVILHIAACCVPTGMCKAILVWVDDWGSTEMGWYMFNSWQESLA